VQPRTWLAIPASAIACAALALLDRAPLAVLALAALGADVAAAVRAFAGPSLAAAIAGATASILSTCCALELHGFDIARGALAAAAAMFAVSEIARPQQPDMSPWPAIGAALAAATLDASFVVLIAITGVRFVRGPWPRRPWSIAIPAFGAVAIVVALAAALTRAGMFANLWTLWSGRSGHALPPVLLGDLLGPIAAVAAVAGLGVCMSRGRLAAATVAALALGSIGADFASGALGVATPALAAVAAGVAIARLAALVRWPLAQPFVGAAAGFVIVLAAAMLRL